MARHFEKPMKRDRYSTEVRGIWEDMKDTISLQASAIMDNFITPITKSLPGKQNGELISLACRREISVVRSVA